MTEPLPQKFPVVPDTPLYLYIHSTDEEPEESHFGSRSLAVRLFEDSKHIAKPVLTPERTAETGLKWIVPCRVEEFYHENGRTQTGYLLKFHADALRLASRSADFAAQLRHAGIKTLRAHISVRRGISDCRISPDPPLGPLSIRAAATAWLSPAESKPGRRGSHVVP